MGEQPADSGRTPGGEVSIPAGPVRARMHGRAVPLLPRSVGVALVVGFLAFVAGVQFAAPQGRGPTVTEIRPDPTDPVTASVLASPEVVLGRSGFATAFNPLARLRDAGLSTCAGSDSGGTDNGRAYAVVVVRCSVPPAGQPAQVRRLEQLITTAIDQDAVRRDGGVAGPDDPDGPTVMSWNYSSDGFEGSVYLATTHAGALWATRKWFVGNPELHKKLDAIGVPHVYEEFADNHSSVDYRMDRSLPILAKALS